MVVGKNPIVLLFCLLFSFQASVFAAVNRLTTSDADGNASGLAVDSSGNIFQMICSPATNQISISKIKPEGDLDSTFGTSGVATISFANSADPSSGSTVRVSNFSNMIISSSTPTTGILLLNSWAYVVLNGNYIFLAVKVLTSSSANGSFVVVRLHNTTGLIDTTYGTSGVAVNEAQNNQHYLKGLVVDSTGRAIIASYNGSTDAGAVRRFTSDGTGSSSFSLTTVTVTNVSSLVLDSQNNIYLGGKISGVGYFCLKLTHDGLTRDGTFANNGMHTVATDIWYPSAIFLATSDTNVYLLYYYGNNSNSFTIRTLTSAGAVSSTETGVFPSTTVSIKDFIRTAAGKFYISGTLADFLVNGKYKISGTITSAGQVAFWSRYVSSNGTIIGDTAFAASGDVNYLSNGVVRIPKTSGKTVPAKHGGLLGYNATSRMLAVGFRETLSSVSSFVCDFGVESDHFLTAATPAELVLIVEDVQEVVQEVVQEQQVQKEEKKKKDKAFKNRAIGGSNIAAIEDGGAVVNDGDDVIVYFRSGNNFVVTKMNEQGVLDSDFGSGVRVIKIASSGANSSTAAISNFTGLTANKPSYITSDIPGNIIIAFQVDISGGSKQVAVIRLDKETGLLDPTFGTGGVATISATPLVHQVNAVAADRNGRVVLLVYRENGDGNKVPLVYRFASNGTADNGFGTAGVKNLGSSTPAVTTASPGLTLKLDVNNNIFVAGYNGSTAPYGMFCMKLNAAAGGINTNFGTIGRYMTGALDQLTTVSPVLLSIYQFESEENIQIISRGTSNGAGIVVVQLDLRTGTPETVFSGSHVSFIPINNLTALNDADRNEEGNLLCGGTLTDNSVAKIFLSRITKAGILDTTYGEASESSQTGTYLFSATSGTIQDGGWFFLDSGGDIPIIWVEGTDQSRRIIIERASSSDDLDFDSTTLASGKSADDLVSFEQGFLLDFDRLYRNMGIARHLLELRKRLDSDTNILFTSTVKDRAVTLFDQAIREMLTLKISSASSNGLKSAHVGKHKQGAMNKIMNKLMKSPSNFTSNEQTALNPYILTQIALIFDDLSSRRNKVTGKKGKNKKQSDE